MIFSRQPYFRPIKPPVKSFIVLVGVVWEPVMDRQRDTNTQANIII